MADQGMMTTLRDLLNQQKPRVPCSLKAGKNTTSPDWPIVSNVTIWNEFNLANLNHDYGYLLDFAVPASHLNSAPQASHALAGAAINEAQDMKKLIGWNDELIRPTLGLAKSLMRYSPGVELLHVYSITGKPARLPSREFPKLAVDHVISLDNTPYQNLVVGLGRPSSKWSGRALASRLPRATAELLWPLRQLADLCNSAKTRYGYIQTDEELVACRFSTDEQGGPTAAIMPVPWSKHGAEELTTDLALWWLCMLALSETEPCYRAAFVEEPARPPPVYQPSPPSDWAALQAGMGSDANDLYRL